MTPGGVVLAPQQPRQTNNAAAFPSACCMDEESSLSSSCSVLRSSGLSGCAFRCDKLHADAVDDDATSSAACLAPVVEGGLAAQPAHSASAAPRPLSLPVSRRPFPLSIPHPHGEPAFAITPASRDAVAQTQVKFVASDTLAAAASLKPAPPASLLVCGHKRPSSEACLAAWHRPEAPASTNTHTPTPLTAPASTSAALSVACSAAAAAAAPPLRAAAAAAHWSPAPDAPRRNVRRCLTYAGPADEADAAAGRAPAASPVPAPRAAAAPINISGAQCHAAAVRANISAWLDDLEQQTQRRRLLKAPPPLDVWRVAAGAAASAGPAPPPALTLMSMLSDRRASAVSPSGAIAACCRP